MSETKKKILILDDESPIAELIGDFCGLLGFETKVLNSGENIVQVVREFQPDLITLDMVMPGMSGLEVLEVLKTDEDTKVIPVIIISSIANNLAMEGLVNQCKGILAKPIHMDKLQEKINKALART